MGDEADEAAEFADSEQDLDRAGEHDDGEQILKAKPFSEFVAVLHCLSRNHRNGSGRAGDHAGPSPEGGGDEAHEHGGPETDQGIDACGEGERDGFRDEREGDGEPGERVVFVVAVLLTEKVKHGGWLVSSLRGAGNAGARAGGGSRLWGNDGRAT